jgi:PleD family two-component response regulator/EAL domain-containing protein (putative c-di-GMP-specific phosphodiesterase class I)
MASEPALDASGQAQQVERWERAWQRLAGSWQRDAAAAAMAAVEALLETSSGAAADRAGDFSAFLAAFIDEAAPPSATQRRRLEELANALRDALGRPIASAGAPQPALPASADRARRDPPPAASLAAARDTHGKVQRNRICVLGLPPAATPGLVHAFSERGLEGTWFQSANEMAAALGDTRPGAMLLSAAALRDLPQFAAALNPTPVAGADAPALVVVSERRDLTDRLLAMRAGAAAFFQAPLDAYRVAARLSELMGRERGSGNRVLLADADRSEAAECAGWLTELGMVARIAASGDAMLAALPEFRPDLVLIVEGLPDARSFELAQMLRQQPEWAMLPLVLVANELSEAQRFDAIAAGADDVLQKPLKARHLSAVVRSRILQARSRAGEAQSLRDPATGLVRRERLIERLGQAPRPGAALLFVALDQPERVRVRVGLAGLALLASEVGRALRQVCAEPDWAAALADFHYLLLVEREDRAQIAELGERLRAAIGACHAGAGAEAQALTASIGIVPLETNAGGVDEIVARAESAALSAQRLGGNRLLWHEPAAGAAASNDPALAVRVILMRPWQDDCAQVEFRPLVPLAGKLGGQFEMDYRLVSTRGQGLRVQHALYAPIAAELGLLSNLERRRLSAALDARSEAVRHGRAIRVLLAVSAAWLLQDGEIDWLSHELAERHLSGSGLGLEIASSEFLDCLAELGPALGKLRQAGIRVGLTDYGRDLAAIHALKRHPLDYLRLFADLVQFAAGRATGDALQAVVRKAHQMHAVVIAPAVDSLESAHALLRLGVDYACGEGLGPARPKPEFDFERPLL